ncbi:Thioredoxin [uncultured virus]|nr:Thioredoxin [uncultured virus]
MPANSGNIITIKKEKPSISARIKRLHIEDISSPTREHLVKQTNPVQTDGSKTRWENQELTKLAAPVINTEIKSDVKSETAAVLINPQLQSGTNVKTPEENVKKVAEEVNYDIIGKMREDNKSKPRSVLPKQNEKPKQIVPTEINLGGKSNIKSLYTVEVGQKISKLTSVTKESKPIPQKQDLVSPITQTRQHNETKPTSEMMKSTKPLLIEESKPVLLKDTKQSGSKDKQQKDKRKNHAGDLKKKDSGSDKLIHIRSKEDYLEFKKYPRGIIFYGAEWCKACKEIEPLYKRICNRYHKKITMAHVDIDEAKLEFTAVPVFVAMHNGKQFDSLEGADRDALRTLVKKTIEFNPAMKSS